MQNLLNELKQILQKDDRFITGDKLLKNKVIEASLQLDPVLLKLLLLNQSIKKHFFQDIDGINVFDKINFRNSSATNLFSLTATLHSKTK